MFIPRYILIHVVCAVWPENPGVAVAGTMVRGGAPEMKRVAGLPLVAALGTAALLMMPQVQAFLPYSVSRPTMPQVRGTDRNSVGF